MRKLNVLLTLLIVGVLLVPGVVVAQVAEACCGVVPINLEVTDAPDPACVGDEVTISGTYNTYWVFEDFDPYDTWVVLRVWAPGDVPGVDTPIVDETIPKGTGVTESPAAEDFSFSYPLTASEEGTYNYEVLAWTTGGPMPDQFILVGGTITVEVCREIDIKPGSDPNSINPKGKGVIPVAILTTDFGFDAATVDPGLVTFGPTGTEASPVQWAMEDVDGDGDIDMILHFKSQDCGFSASDETGTLVCNQGSASDSVNIVPKGK